MVTSVRRMVSTTVAQSGAQIDTVTAGNVCPCDTAVNRAGVELSTTLVIVKGLKVAFPDPAPPVAEPMGGVFSIEKLQSLISNALFGPSDEESSTVPTV